MIGAIVSERGFDFAVEHDQQAIADGEFVEIVGYDEHARARRADARDRREQGALGSDIDALGRPGQNQQLRAGRERATHQPLLLIAAAQLRDRLIGRGGDDAQLVDQFLRPRKPASGNDEAETPEGVCDRDRQILLQREQRKDAAMVAIARHVADAEVARAPGLAERQRLSADPHGSRGRFLQSGDDLAELLLAGAGEAGQPDALSPANIEGDVANGAVQGHAIDLQNGGRDRVHGRGARTEIGGADGLVADHRAHQGVPGQILQLGVGDDLAVAQHRHASADLVELLEVMRYVDERDAVLLQRLQTIEQLVDLAPLQFGRWLVQDDETTALQKGAADLDDLPLIHAEARGLEVRIDIQIPIQQNRAGLLAHPPPIDGAGRSQGLVVEKEILGDRQGRKHGPPLIHARHPLPPRGAIGDGRRRFAAELHGARSRRLQARQNADQRRFAGAVAADEAARVLERNRYRDVLEDGRGSKRLPHRLHRGGELILGAAESGGGFGRCNRAHGDALLKPALAGEVPPHERSSRRLAGRSRGIRPARSGSVRPVFGP